MSAPIAPTIDTNHVLALSDARAGIVALFLSTSARADAASRLRRRHAVGGDWMIQTILTLFTYTKEPCPPRHESFVAAHARASWLPSRAARRRRRARRPRPRRGLHGVRARRSARAGGVSRAPAQKHTRDPVVTIIARERRARGRARARGRERSGEDSCARRRCAHGVRGRARAVRGQ